ncbi:MAG: PEP-CTERM sorting domain-containing protein [Armatimonadota bacterium]|nr:PEP-CTERM sorting domain-containing protein [bacterium]
MRNNYRLYAGIAALILLWALGTPAGAASWADFKTADISGIYLTPSPATDVLTYTLTLGSNPTITIDGHTYAVNWVQAYYLVSQDKTTSIGATDANVVTLWTWESKSNPGDIAGWHGEGSNRITPGKEKIFEYKTLNIDNNAVLSGLHVGYQLNSTTEDTDFFKTTLSPEVPEASSMALFGSGLITLCPMVWRRRRKI